MEETHEKTDQYDSGTVHGAVTAAGNGGGGRRQLAGEQVGREFG